MHVFIYRIFGLLLLSVILLGCDEGEGEDEVINNDAPNPNGAKPPNRKNRPCSPQNLAFFKANLREADNYFFSVGEAVSDAKLTINKQPITIVGFDQQFERYSVYYMYSGEKRVKDSNNQTTLSIKTKLTVCERQKLIIVYESRLQFLGYSGNTQISEMVDRWAFEINDPGEDSTE